MTFMSVVCRSVGVAPVLVFVAAAAAGAGAATDAADARAVPVAVDIVPGLCPNHLRIDSQLTIPVAIIGTEDLDVTAIEPATVRLSGDGRSDDILPLNYEYRDVGSPLIGGRCECQELVGDGLKDLVFYFDAKALVAALDLGGRIGDTVPLSVSGELVTGQAISGVDCAVVIDATWASSRLDRELGFLADAGAQQADGHFRFAYFCDVSDHMTLAIYDLRGREVAGLVDMDLGPGIYYANWAGTCADGQRAAAGTYFARVSNSRTGETLKFDVQRR